MNRIIPVTNRTALLLAAALSLFGCTTMTAQPPASQHPDTQGQQSMGCQDRQNRLSETKPSCITNQSQTTSKGRINHVVLAWLKEPGNAVHRESIIEISRTLRKIPGVLEVRVGEVVSSERNIVDDSFDVGILVVFANTDDMTRYIHHPRHKHAVREVIRPLVERIVVYDFVE